MNWNNIFAFILCLGGCFACQEAKNEVNVIAYDNGLIEAKDLATIIDEDSVVVIDMRKPEAYQKQHIPGAVNIWRTDIQENTLPYGGIIASKSQLEDLLGKHGISRDHFLVIYDDKASCDAARLWWVLDFYGFNNVALLHGGVKAWQTVGQLTHEKTIRPQSKFTFQENYSSSRFVDLKELIAIYKDTTIVIIDSRTEDEYNGYYMKTGAYDSGKIPGSIHIDWASNVDYEKQLFKTIDDIKTNYTSNMIDSGSNIVVYCHSGVRSAHTTFVLTQLLGYNNVKNYDGSWTEWTYHKLPVERPKINEVLK
ncbi:sulfurtransferase [Fulvivirga sp. RKSG066]|uniref:sulfurtransferase n=1 Tax=Fulvivirga aurantia TaxID=2529383 RepID=UPI0012BD4243|nr:sulfurtransferase [Fulvivirga aurantia]MTI21501.1 sulfurtransferase [Fulvivirga aurantia]